MRDGIVGVSAAGSAREGIKRLWKSYFADPSRWWDYREFKRNPKAPDFQHKTSKESLWLDGSRNPSWVIPMLEKRKQECPSLRLPTTVLEEDKKTAPQGCVPSGLPTFSEECVLKTTAKKKMLANSSCVISSHMMEEPKLKMMVKEKRPMNSSTVTSSLTLEDPKLKMTAKKTKVSTNSSRVTSSHTLELPKLKMTAKKKKPTNSSGADTLKEHSMKMKKCSVIGRVCDWHSLSLEDAIDGLEKGSFSEPSIETLVYIVCKCTKKKDRHYASRLLAYLRRNGLDSHKSLGNYLVSMLVEVENMCDAQDVFDRLVSKSECTWNALIKGYIKSGELEQAITLYKSMRKDHCLLHLSGYTFVALLKACTTLKDVDVGRQVHADIAREGLLKTNPYVGNSLVDMYAKCSSLGDAQKVFDRLPIRDVVTWTSLIAGYAQHEQGGAALRCFKQMQGSGVAPNAFTFACILKACGSLRNSIIGREVHVKVEEEGFLEDSQIVGNALVDMYAKCGMVAKAQEVLNSLPVRDVISWNALITGYVEHAYSMEALVCFKLMQSEGISPNAITFSCILKACASARAIEKGKEIHLEIVRKGLLKRDLVLGSSLVDMYAKCGFLAKAKAVFDKLPVRDAVAWTALIAGYAQHDAGEKALVCFKQMRAQGISPDAIAYACSLKACGSIGATKIGTEIHNDIAERGLLKRDLLLANAVVDMYSKCGMLAKAQEVFADIPIHDVFSWTALMTGYAQLGDVEDVLRIFGKMREECVNPTPVTLLTILNACGNVGLVDKATAHLEAMSEAHGIIPTLEHHTCMVDLLGRVGQLNRAVALVANAPFHPNVVMWLTLLSACQKWGHVELAREAFEQVILLDESEASAYICMSNIYADATMHDDVNMVNAMHVKSSLEEAGGLWGDID